MFKKILTFFIFLEKHKFYSLVIIFLLRLFYGISYRFWGHDEFHIYLIGLKFYTTGEWPFWGPDIVYTQTQIPGALQGLLVGLPLFLLPIPEAPFILLHILSFSALCLLAFYICKRLPDMPKWLVWGGILLNPWGFNLSTYIVNPSYVLFGAVLFFISFLESLPKLTIGFISRRFCFFLMGFATFWIMQLHMSWVLLPFFTFFAIFAFIDIKKLTRLNIKKTKEKSIQIIYLLIYYFLGCLIISSTLVPTYIYYGFNILNESTQNIVLNTENYKDFFVILARYLSFACYEIPRFLDLFDSNRLYFFKEAWWAAPFTLFLVLLGFLQVIVILIVSFFSSFSSSSFFASVFNKIKKNKTLNVEHRQKKWISLRNIVYGAFLFLFLSFFFSVQGPSSHTFYLFFPLVNIFAMYVWERCSPNWVCLIAALSFISAIIFYSASLYLALPRSSLYSNRPWLKKEGIQKKTRDVVIEAMQKKDYKILGTRRYEVQ